MAFIEFLDLGPHAAFILWSYGICLAVVIGLVCWIRIDRGRQDAALRDLEAQGIGRRGAAGTRR